jgi:hypothetical protein
MSAMLASIDAALLGVVSGAVSVEEQKANDLADSIYTDELIHFCSALRIRADRMKGRAAAILKKRSIDCFNGQG